MNEPPAKNGRGMTLAMIACAAMCGLPVLIASTSVLATPLLGPVALAVGVIAVPAVVLWRRRTPSACSPVVPDRDDGA